MIRITNLNKTYKMGNNVVHALKNINIQIIKGEFIALKGPSGSGKTTLLNILGVLDSPDSGEIYFNDIEITKLKKKQRFNFRREYLGFIFQHFNLIPELNVYENIEIPLLISNIKNRKEKILQIIEEVGLIDHIRHRPFELSGGQMQRVSIARALVKEPALILADEPTANLDRKTGENIIKLISNLNKTHNSTIIIATHDQMIIEKIENVLEIIDGEILN